ncbi:MAG: peptidoglycan-associated lipoprotein Pal [Desulfarculus sp.]|nr:peptidoglycan-associated lipoprotein Pal [Desulfarculus sp.]
MRRYQDKLGWMVFGVCALLLLGLAGCASTPTPAPETVAPAPAPTDDAAERLRQQAAIREAQLRTQFENQDIHFDFDRYDLRPEARQILNEKAAYLLERNNLSVIIEGHCDDRGSSAYNLALGEKRALAAKAYLQSMGVAAQRMETVSYGKERPLVPGHTEEAYAANRRGHFVVK